MFQKMKYIHKYSVLDHLSAIPNDYKSVYCEVDFANERVYISQEYQVLYTQKITQHDLLNMYTLVNSALRTAEEVGDFVFNRDEALLVIIYCQQKA